MTQGTYNPNTQHGAINPNVIPGAYNPNTQQAAINPNGVPGTNDYNTQAGTYDTQPQPYPANIQGE